MEPRDDAHAVLDRALSDLSLLAIRIDSGTLKPPEVFQSMHAAIVSIRFAISAIRNGHPERLTAARMQEVLGELPDIDVLGSSFDEEFLTNADLREAYDVALDECLKEGLCTGRRFRECMQQAFARAAERVRSDTRH